MTHSYRLSAGNPALLGSTWDGGGTNFAVFAEDAYRVELCIFEQEAPHAEIHRFRLLDHQGPIWHGYIRNIEPGMRYGFRIDGPYRPLEGLRYNSAKLLVDPYARAISGSVDWDAPVFGYQRGHRHSDLSIDQRDNAFGMPHAIVIDERFDWRGDRHPLTGWPDTVIYETHLKGFTQLHPLIPESERGTYRGFAHPAVIEYLLQLGVTAIELLPIQAFVDDDFLVERGLRNFWGYNTLGFFAPEGRYSASGDRGSQVVEFKEMVRSFHEAGIEILLDVVYNHTAEGGHLGPTLSFRGIDNRAYYRLFRGEPRYYEDVTGTGNTVNAAHPQTLKLIMDSLRYWIEVMHVDGFRFDLAPALGREDYDFSSAAAFFRAVHQDPVISRAKLIAEPWDVGDGGYQLGAFPNGWHEWNDRFRDTVRRFWRGDRGVLGDLGFRLTGSSDLYKGSRRGPFAGINFVTAHDGYTLRDLVSYENKHNEANGEHNRDGSDHNSSSNYGTEGPVCDQAINSLRNRQMRNLIATTILAHGAPMLLAGDELRRTQQGNNNAYCQDNEVSWVDWNVDEEADEMLAFVRRALQIRREFAAFRQQEFYTGARLTGVGGHDVDWYRPDGRLMTLNDWADHYRMALAFRLIPSRSVHRKHDADHSPVFVALNADGNNHRFRLPNPTSRMAGHWECLLTTDEVHRFERTLPGGKTFLLQQRSMCVYRLNEQATLEAVESTA